MLYREIIAVCSQIHTKHTNTLCGQNVEFVNVKTGGTNGFFFLNLRTSSFEYLIYGSWCLKFFTYFGDFW